MSNKVTLVNEIGHRVSNLVNVDAELAARVAAGLAMPVPPAAAPVRDLEPSPALRIIRGEREIDTLKGKTVGVLIAEDSDPAELASIASAIEAAGGVAKIIARRGGGTVMKGGSKVKADGQLAGTPSARVDAVALVLSDKGCASLRNEAAAVPLVMDAFGRLKAVGASPQAQPLLAKAGVIPGEGVGGLEAFVGAAGRRCWDREPSVRDLP